MNKSMMLQIMQNAWQDVS